MPESITQNFGFTVALEAKRIASYVTVFLMAAVKSKVTQNQAG
jgi:hypothetical protein